MTRAALRPDGPTYLEQTDPETGEVRRLASIESLAEGATAVLVGHGWEAPGFWEWRMGGERRNKPRRAYFIIETGRPPLRLRASERPSHFVVPTVPVRRPRRAHDSAPPAVVTETEPAADSPFAARILQAFKVDRALPDKERATLAVKVWPFATAPGPGDYPVEAVTRFRPSAADVDDWLVVMSWVAHVEAAEFHVLRLRALGLGFRTIGEEVGRNEQAVQRLYLDAVIAVWRAARGQSTPRAGRRRGRTGGRPIGRRARGF